ncbi:aldo/keto reductase [Alicyclobacillus fodiniaquatilis]|uniref:Aldo/keto reductase n=1 Tax=Alicyclobacillus fodiniaquatilis TaxID=1661150 RepID=A0ABW4JNS2_9BACL
MTRQEKAYQLGKLGPNVSRIGLGCMGMSGMYGEADRQESIATIHAALDAGVNLLDTGDFYGMGHNELLIRDALQSQRREDVLISVKFGGLRAPSGEFVGYDCRPIAVKNFLSYSLQRLGVDYIDIYRPARMDPSVPVEETIGAIADMVKAGYVRYIGLSEVGADTLRRAQSVHSICDLQIEYSLMSRGIEAEILPTARELGIGITAYGVLSRGLLSGRWSREHSQRGDIRGMMPRFQGENLERNLALVDALRKIAEEKNVTVSQISMAWVYARGVDIIPLIGARRRDQLVEAQEALKLELSQGDLERIEAAIPIESVAGTRYAASQMAHLDSERSAQ